MIPFIFLLILHFYFNSKIDLILKIWGLGIGDWGLGVWAQNPKPKTQNPKPKTQKKNFFFFFFINEN